MPVKIFQWLVHANTQTLEEQINRWIEEHPDLWINHIAMTSVQFSPLSLKLYACVYYRPVRDIACVAVEEEESA